MLRATTGGGRGKKVSEEMTFQILQVDPERGEITAFGERFMIVPINLIHSIEDRLVELVSPATATIFLYEIGKQAGRDYVRLLKRTGNSLKTIEDAQDASMQLGTLAGWGKIEAIDFQPGNKYIRMRWTNGVSIRRRDGNTPACHFIRGIMAGGSEEVFGRKTDSIEVMCEAMGDPYCEAIFADPAAIGEIAEKVRYARPQYRPPPT